MVATTLPIIDVIIPALNEETGIVKVINDLPKHYVRYIVVVDNGSTDNTAARASEVGAILTTQTVRGYGSACLQGITYLKEQAKEAPPHIVVFLDADYSDDPTELPKLVAPIVNQQMDMVIGSRAIGNRQQGAMTIPQLFGNWLATRLLRWLYGVHFTDLGPFRAIKWGKLLELNMQDRDFGWTVEMQAKAAKYQLKCTEIPVSYRRRSAGKSKVSGTIKGTILAGYKILYTIFKLL